MDSPMLKTVLNPLAPVSGKKHCDVLFLILILSLVVVIFTVIGFLRSLYSKKEGMTYFALFAIAQAAIVHHVYRIIYTMCLNVI